jgi:hypothetical protein
MFYTMMYFTILWRIDPLLGKDRETNETTAVAKQQLARQWTGWVVITWEPQESTCSRGTVANSVFYAVHAKGLSMGQVYSLVQLWDIRQKLKNLHC